jgi:hypothetical protein
MPKPTKSKSYILEAHLWKQRYTIRESSPAPRFEHRAAPTIIATLSVSQSCRYINASTISLHNPRHTLTTQSPIPTLLLKTVQFPVARRQAVDRPPVPKLTPMTFLRGRRASAWGGGRGGGLSSLECIILYVLGLKTSVLPTSIWHSQMCQ